MVFVSFWLISFSMIISRSIQYVANDVVVVQLLSCGWLCDPMDCSMPSFPTFTVSCGLLKLMSIESIMLSNHLILCRPLLLLPSVFPSIRVFSDKSALPIRWPKYWNISFSISPSNEYSGLISFRIDWLDLLAVQGTHKSLLQHHSSNASILHHSMFFMVQLSYPWASLVAQLVKTPPAMWFDPWVRMITWKRDRLHTAVFLAFRDGSDGKESACNAGDLGLIPGLERSPREGHGNPLQCSCLKNSHGQRSLVSYSLWGHKESDTKGN